MLDFSNPAANVQLLKTLRQGCDFLGLLIETGAIVTHSIKRGTASEVAHLPKKLTGTSESDAARVLGHSHNATKHGITGDYIGRLKEDTWKRRLEVEFGDDFIPALAAQPFKRARQSTEAVKEICEELNLDPNDERERNKARFVGRSRLRADWLSQAQNAVEDAAGQHDDTLTTQSVANLERPSEHAT